MERWSVCWLVSAIVNLVAWVTAAVCLLPLERVAGPFTLIATAETEEGSLEMLSESAETLSLDFGLEREVVEPEWTETPEVHIELDLAGGGNGDGPGGGQGGSGGEGVGGGTDYFGTIAYGNRFVYILDKSTSMNWGQSGEAAPDSRFARARYELLRSIDKLAPSQSFYVILFSTSTRCMFDDSSSVPVAIPATKKNKSRLRKWLEAAHVGGGTDPREALVLALSIEPDAVFLLSDGDFSTVRPGRRNALFDARLEAEELVRRINRVRTPIHTFAYEDASSKRRMEALAEISAGEYKYIPPSERPKRRSIRRR